MIAISDFGVCLTIFQTQICEKLCSVACKMPYNHVANVVILELET